MASPQDMSVTSSTSCADDQSVKTSADSVMIDSSSLQRSSEHGDAEVSSSCEMQPRPLAATCSLIAVDALTNQVTYRCIVTCSKPCDGNAIAASDIFSNLIVTVT